MDEIAFYNRTLTASEIVALKDSVKCDGGLAPTQVSSDVSSVNENKPVQTLVGLLSALDQDSVDAHVFQLVPGAGSDDNASVEVYRNQLRLAVKPDFETKSQYSIQIRVTDSDGNSFEQPMTVSINDLLEVEQTVVGDGSKVRRLGDTALLDGDQDGTEDGNYDFSFNVLSSSPPMVTPPSNQNATEGTAQSFSLGSFSDADGGPWSVDVDWNDGSAHTIINPVATADALGTVSHTYGEQGTYNPVVKVTDSTHLFDSSTFLATVTNVAPTATLQDNSGVNTILDLIGNNRIYMGHGGNTVTVGNDTITTGNSNDIIDGGAGNDTIDGGNGRDLLIGGTGADRITGKNDDDILIAGYTSSIHRCQATTCPSYRGVWNPPSVDSV